MKQISLLAESMVSKATILNSPQIFDQILVLTKARRIWSTMVNRAAVFLLVWLNKTDHEFSEIQICNVLAELATVLLITAIICNQPRLFQTDWKEVLQNIDSGLGVVFFSFFFSKLKNKPHNFYPSLSGRFSTRNR